MYCLRPSARCGRVPPRSVRVCRRAGCPCRRRHRRPVRGRVAPPAPRGRRCPPRPTAAAAPRTRKRRLAGSSCRRRSWASQSGLLAVARRQRPQDGRTQCPMPVASRRADAVLPGRRLAGDREGADTAVPVDAWVVGGDRAGIAPVRSSPALTFTAEAPSASNRLVVALRIRSVTTLTAWLTSTSAERRLPLCLRRSGLVCVVDPLNRLGGLQHDGARRVGVGPDAADDGLDLRVVGRAPGIAVAVDAGPPGDEPGHVVRRRSADPARVARCTSWKNAMA